LLYFKILEEIQESTQVPFEEFFPLISSQLLIIEFIKMYTYFLK